MIKKLLAIVLLSCSVKAATIYYTSTNAFVAGTNTIYGVITTLSNSVVGSTFVSSNNLVTSSWSSLLTTNLYSNNSTVTNLATLGSVKIGGSSGSTISKVLFGGDTLDFGSVATNALATLPITVTGAGTNGVVILNVVSPNANFVYNAVISATNTVTVRAANISINAVDPAATSVNVLVFQP